MTSSGREMLVAVGLLATSIAGLFFVRSEREAAETALSARESQLHQLDELRQRVASGGLPHDVDWSAFSGLFEGFELCAAANVRGSDAVVGITPVGRR